MRSRFKLFLQVLILFALCLSVGGGLMSGGSSPALAQAESASETALEVPAIDPETGANDVDLPVVITGAGFAETPQVFLGDHELVEVNFVSENELEAVVPWGLPADVYDLRVVNPDEAEFIKENAFTVTKGLGNFITNGPYGGQAVQLAFHKDDPSIVYALMYGAGLFLSEEGGANWAQLNNHDWPIQLAFDAADPEILYFGADGNDLYRSLDQGLNWQSLTTDIQSENGCYRTYPVAHPTKAGVVYFGMGSCGNIPLAEGEGGVYYSDSYGDLGSWQSRNVGLTDLDIQSLAIHPDGQTMVAGTYTGKTFYSLNGGLEWQEGDPLAYGVSRIFINPYEDQQAWAITREDTLGIVGDAKVYRSDNLKNWTEVTGLEIHQGGGSSQAQMAFLNDSIWLACNKLYKSTDNGNIWEEMPVIRENISAIAIRPGEPQVIYLGDDFGIAKSTDEGLNWTEVNNGLAAMVPQALAVSSSDLNQVYVKTHQGIYKSTDAGSSWLYLDHGIGGFPGGSLLAVGLADDQILYYTTGCTGEFCLYKSTDGGMNWDRVTGNLPPQYAGWDCESFTIQPVPLTPERVIVGASVVDPDTKTYKGIFFYSDDQGETWDYIVPNGAIDRITEIEYDLFDPNLVYAGTHSSGLWHSEDGGESWESIPVGDPALEPPVHVSSIAVHPNDPNKVFVRAQSNAVTENPEPEIWASADCGATWSPLEYVFLGVDLIVTPPLADQTFYSLYTGCEGGLCRSVDDGLTWVVNSSVPRPEILACATDGERSILYMGTPGGLVNTASTREVAAPGLGSISGGGVYRLTELLQVLNFYLPVMRGGSAP